MRGLIVKDMITITKQARTFLVIILFFALTSNFSGSSFAMVYAAMMPISALAYDENCKWDQLAAMMPYSVRDIVLSKYIFGYICLLVTGGISFASLYVVAAVKGTPVSAEDIVGLAVVTCAALIFLAVNLPWMFRLGVEKGRLVFMAMIGAIVLIVVGFSNNIANGISSVYEGGGFAAVAAALAALAVAANAVSIALSQRAYKRKMR